MLTWHLYIDHINHRLAEAIHQHQFHFDGAWNREHMHLEHLFYVEVEVRPGDSRLVRL